MRRSSVVAATIAALFIITQALPTLAQNQAAAPQSKRFTATLCGDARIDAEIKAPPAGANPRLVEYHKVWTGGMWGSTRCNAFVSTELTAAGTLKGFYIFGSTADIPLGYSPIEATLDAKGNLRFKSQLGADVTYVLRPDGKLAGTFIPKGSSESFELGRYLEALPVNQAASLR